MRGWSWASSAAFVSCGQAVAVHEEDRVAGLGRPRSGRHGEGGSSAEMTTTASLLLPRAAVWKASSARASAKGSRPRCRSCAGPAAGDVADAHDLGAARGRDAGGCRAASASRWRAADRGRWRAGAARHRWRRSTAPAIPARQSRESISATAAGRFSGWWRGRPPARRRPLWRSGRRRRCASCSSSRRPGSRGRRGLSSPPLTPGPLGRRRRRRSCGRRAPRRPRARRAGQEERRGHGEARTQSERRATTAPAGTARGPSAASPKTRASCIVSRASGRLPRINAESPGVESGSGGPSKLGRISRWGRGRRRLFQR